MEAMTEKTRTDKDELESIEVTEDEGAEAAQPEDESCDFPAIDVEALVAERDEAKDQHLRLRAEFDNYRKRVARDAEATRQRATESLIYDLLSIVDHLELALSHAEEGGALAEGVQMVVDQLHDVLGRRDVQAIPAKGETFDPQVHEAVMQTDSADVPADVVAQEFQKGYKLGGRVLRPSKVSVSRGGPAPAEEPDGLEAPPEENEDDA